jgi:hypothetical protein
MSTAIAWFALAAALVFGALWVVAYAIKKYPVDRDYDAEELEAYDRAAKQVRDSMRGTL